MFNATLYADLIEPIPVERRSESVIRELVLCAGGFPGEVQTGTSRLTYHGTLITVRNTRLEVFDEPWGRYGVGPVELIHLGQTMELEASLN